MSKELEALEGHRAELNKVLDAWDENWVKTNWARFSSLMDNWWKAYKKWESTDTFNEAFKDKRMTVRTFAGGNEAFQKQVSKNFAKGTISLASYNKQTRETEVRIFADSRYKALDPGELKEHDKTFHKTDEKWKYHAQRGIDSSAFALPANFATREKKYAEGLHDLSASLLNPKLSIFDQIHNSEDGTKGEGAHFSFLPLSMEEDQEVLYNLTRRAKDLRVTLPQLYLTVRGYRAEMTRVKLAQEFDMAIGYTAVLTPHPDRPEALQYKLRYGLGKTTTITGAGGKGQQTVLVTADRYKARQEAARKFKSIIGIRDAKNEVVIAIRKHAGPFPVYAVRCGNELACYNIVGGALRYNAYRISSNGRFGRSSMLETGTAGLPVRQPARILPYNVPFDTTFPSRLEKALEDLGEIPRRSGLRVFVIGPRYDAVFAGVLGDVEKHARDLNGKGYRLSVADVPNRPGFENVEVRLYFV